jgi:hypothetical protein
MIGSAAAVLASARAVDAGRVQANAGVVESAI